MKREPAILRRRLFTALSVLSLLLCVATLALWVRSHAVAESLAYVNDIDDGTGFHVFVDQPTRPAWSQAMWHDEWRLTSAQGSICLYHDRSDTSFRSGSWTTRGWHYSRDAHWSVLFRQQRTGLPAALGVSYTSHVTGLPKKAEFPSWSSSSMLTFPHWMLAVAAGILPALHLRSTIRSRRHHRAGHCRHCGYDLRATPERCPECGTPKA